MGGFDGSENAPQINSTTPGDAFQFDAEQAETLEIGAKMDFPDRSLRASICLLLNRLYRYASINF